MYEAYVIGRYYAMAVMAKNKSKLFTQVKEILLEHASASAPVTFGRPTVWALTAPEFSQNTYDEVYPRLFLGDTSLACDRPQMKALGISHVVNAAQGKKFSQIDTNEDFYRELDIAFLGIPAMDFPGFRLDAYFNTTADFIEAALANPEAKVYVHCQMGRSRSATLVLVYLMLKCNITLLQAVILVKKKRNIFPNDGFLGQLCSLNNILYSNSEDGITSGHDTGACGDSVVSSIRHHGTNIIDAEKCKADVTQNRDTEMATDDAGLDKDSAMAKLPDIT